MLFAPWETLNKNLACNFRAISINTVYKNKDVTFLLHVNGLWQLQMYNHTQFKK